MSQLTRVFVNLVFILVFGTALHAQQTEEDRVKLVVNQLFDGMRKNDTALIRSLFVPGTALQSVATTREGKTVLETDALDSFLAIIARPHTELYDERIVIDAVKIDGALASVWAPYKFYLGDKFSHCGVDVFQLMKTKEGWKFIYLVDTRRRDRCPD